MNRRSPSLTKSLFKSRAFLRRPLTHVSAAAMALLFASPAARAANAGDAVKTGATDLGINTTTTYTAVATPTSDVQFLAATAYTTSTPALSAPLAIGTLDDLNATPITINGTALLTLSTAANSTAGANAADLLFVGTGANLTINDTAGITFAVSGNIDAVGALSLGASPINIGATTQTFTGAGGTTVGGVIGATTGALTVNKAGGTLTLSGLNLYTGGTSVNAGTLSLDFSASAAPTTATNIIKSGNTVNLGGGALVVKGGGAGATNTQTFGTTALTANTASTITANLNGGTALNLALGGITRNAQSTVDITVGGANITTTGTTFATNGVLTSAAANGIAFATVNGGTAFASNTTGTIGAITPVAGTYGATANVSVSPGDSSSTGANTLTFNGAADTVAFTGASTAITTGGILLTPSATGASAITGGTLTAGGGKELTIFNNEPTASGSLTISSVIANNAAGASTLTISGAGTTTLSGANTFTGQTALLGGTLNLSNQLALPNSTLQANTGTSVVFDQSVAGNAFTVGALGGGANIALQNNATTPAPIALTVGGNNASTTYSGVLSGAGSLTQKGTGQLTLPGASTYTGTTTVTGGGTIQISSDASLGAVPASVVANQLTLDNGRLQTNPGSGGRVTLSANRGITLGTGGGTLDSGTINNASLTVNGVIAGSGALTLNGSNAGGRDLQLNGANTYTGNTSILNVTPLILNNATGLGIGGTVSIGTTGSGNTPSVRIGGFTVANPITVTPGGARQFLSNGTTSTLSGAITLTGGAVNPTLNLGNAGSNQALNITGGVTGTGNIALGAGSSNNLTGAQVNLSGGAINNVGTITNTTVGTAFAGTNTISSVIGANVTGIISATGTEVIPLVLSGNNSGANFFGDTTLTSGTINLQNANALANSVVNTNATAGALTFGAGTTNITVAQIGGLNGTGGATAGGFGDIVLVNSGTGAGALALSVGNSNAANGSATNPNTLNPSYAGIISGAGSITKNGTNPQTLAGANTYSGGTMVGGGILATVATGTFGTGNVTVTGTGTLTLGNTASIASTGSLLFAGTTTAINLNFSGTDTVAGITDTTSGVSENPGSYSATQLNTDFGVTFFAGSGLLQVVPEPSTWVLLIGGFGVMAGALRFRNRRA